MEQYLSNRLKLDRGVSGLAEIKIEVGKSERFSRTSTIVLQLQTLPNSTEFKQIQRSVR